MTVAVLYGGRSGEHEVSLVSAAAVARNITDHKIILIGITKDGLWFLQDENEYKRICADESAKFSIVENDSNRVSVVPGAKTQAFCVNGKALKIDVVFPVLHGTFGEDGTMQGLCEMADIPYVGCGVLASAVTMDKEKTKLILEQAGIKTVPFVCLKRSDLMNSAHYDEIIKQIIKEFGFPLFVKPCNAGSSDGASKAENEKQLSVALMDAFNWDNKVLIEKAINAREIECSVTGNSVTAPEGDDVESVTAYMPGEILPSHQFYDYDAKYNDPSGASLLIPADLKEENIEKIRKIAVNAYKALDLSGLSRIDFFVDKDTNKLYLNEVNSIPGFTSISMFPKMCEAAGLPFKDLTELLIQEALRLYKIKASLKTSR
ncbi:D-alanine--D-alanine ligase [Treponema parvum]|uniref:D-alanine--D-alanine ligase n=1 Tax=Treponema parvum TaxID=138851 RepID=A0A975IBL2_9SPIR|nr:D-alanine--D-alanine ligase family protein [Treponema parvum]QTQ11131.1 D-alanine--D-alanine ligase [Treponema parvum]QTQ16928.1 D-alanine--D-alanine ligase [Treponema parvum]